MSIFSLNIFYDNGLTSSLNTTIINQHNTGKHEKIQA